MEASFEEEGPAALMGYRKGQKGSRLPEHVRRAILMMKEQHPDWGQDRIHDMLLRTRACRRVRARCSGCWWRRATRW